MVLHLSDHLEAVRISSKCSLDAAVTPILMKIVFYEYRKHMSLTRTTR